MRCEGSEGARASYARCVAGQQQVASIGAPGEVNDMQKKDIDCGDATALNAQAAHFR